MSVYDVNGNDLRGIVYDANGELLEQAYDAEGNPLIGYILVENIDNSSGEASGYSLTSTANGKNYILRRVINFYTDVHNNYQSFVYDYDNGLYYKFYEGTTVYAYNSEMQKVRTITMPSDAGHKNDGVYYDGSIYFSNLNANNLYAWNITNNTVSSLPITGIAQPGNGSTRECDAICVDLAKRGKLYLICRDVYTNGLVHQASDKLSIYEYTISTKKATLLAEFPWDCVYVQGATYYKGIIYVACNTQTTSSASNYKGITVKCIRTDTWELIDKLTVSGSFEPEGMDIASVDSNYQLMMGMAKYDAMAQAVRFTPPYELVSY